MLKRSHESKPDGRTKTDNERGNAKRRKLPFGRSASHSPKGVDLSIRQLDPAIPQEAQRMKTRFKMILKGKNTSGYDEYKRKFPKDQRRSEHPNTPDHTSDIPNRRWQGQVRAWRIALHQYDPKDLSSDLALLDSATTACAKLEIKNTQSEQKPKTVQDNEIAKASNEGLQVDFSAPETEIGKVADSTIKHDAGNDIDKWENNEEELVDFDDSDDDLL